ncbi:MAG: hypothetical protein HY741_12275 [Chloroflexi bacterium]|nr:hypothetical protein [Chloroflexota bacterium]
MKVGDKVHWTKVSRGRRTVSMKRMEGEIVAISGEIAMVKTKSGKQEVPLAALRLPDAPSAVTEFVDAMRAASKT